MTDNSDGTYTYNYVVNRPGKITVVVFLYKQGGIYNEFYPNTSRSGNSDYNTVSSQLNYDWGAGVIYLSYSDHVSGKFFFRLKGPTTGSVTFTLGSDDGAALYFDGSLLITNPC